MLDPGRLIVPVVLSNGLTIHVESTRLKGDNSEHDVADVTRIFSFDSVRDTVIAISCEIASAIDQIKPDKASVEFGVETAVEGGHLTALIVKGSATANLKISLEWDSRPRTSPIA